MQNPIIAPSRQGIKVITVRDQQTDTRYQDFITAVGEWEGVWGLYHNGWLLHRCDESKLFCPLFATRDAAQSWGASIRTNHVAGAITLVDVIEHLIPDWQSQNIMAGICPTPALGPVLIRPDKLSADLLGALKAAMTVQFGRKS